MSGCVLGGSHLIIERVRSNVYQYAYVSIKMEASIVSGFLEQVQSLIKLVKCWGVCTIGEGDSGSCLIATESGTSCKIKISTHLASFKRRLTVN